MGAAESVTEWLIPFADSQPFQIAAVGTSVFYLTAAYDQNLGRLDIEQNTVTEWPLSHPGASPGDIEIRPSDGAVFVTGVAPDGTIVFPIGGPSSPFQIMRLDPATGVFTAWQLADQPLFGSVLDPAGNFFFTQYSSIYGVTRLNPATGRLTTWATPDLLNSESMVLLSGHIFVGSALSTALEALDPSAAGQDVILPPLFYEAVSSRSLVVTPTTETLSGQQAPAEVTRRTVQRQTVGAFVIWPLPGTPRMLATVPGAVYYTDESEPVIARLVLAPL
jgi:streptogramin lyase